MWRVETDAFDSAMLAAHNKLHGRTDRALAEAALLPVAPWNAGSPGYLVSEPPFEFDTPFEIATLLGYLVGEPPFEFVTPF
jgi:hypothetical protein